MAILLIGRSSHFILRIRFLIELSNLVNMNRNLIESLKTKIIDNKIILLYIVLCIIWSTTWSAIKIGLTDTPPSVGIALRFTLGSMILFVYIFLRGKRIHSNKDYLLFYFLVGIFNAGLSYYLTYIGMEYIPSSLSSILWTSLPLVVGILAHFFVKGERSRIINLLLV